MVTKPKLFPNKCLYCGQSLELDRFSENNGNHKLVGKTKFIINKKTHIEPYRQFCSPLQSNATNRGTSRECVRENQHFEKLIYGKTHKNYYNFLAVQLLVENCLWQMIERKPRKIMHMHILAVLKGKANPNIEMLKPLLIINNF